MAGDVVALMDRLGHPRFAVVGHDRGQRVAYRCALDHPDAVAALAVLDGVPMLEAVERADARFALEWWHWFFFAGSPHAERVITADPVAWYGLDAEQRGAMGEENFDYVAAALHDPLTVRAMLEDYRAGLCVDPENDRVDRELGRAISCPTLVAWSVHDDLEHLYGDPAAIWRPWVDARSARRGSTAGTTWPRRTRSSWPTCSSRSWPRPPGRGVALRADPPGLRSGPCSSTSPSCAPSRPAAGT